MLESDRVLTGVLSLDPRKGDPRKGVAAPNLRVHGRPAVLCPCPGASLASAVSLAVGADDP
eukprot:1254576-Pleurochrysis_carterae.AAC.1